MKQDSVVIHRRELLGALGDVWNLSPIFPPFRDRARATAIRLLTRTWRILEGLPANLLLIDHPPPAFRSTLKPIGIAHPSFLFSIRGMINLWIGQISTLSKTRAITTEGVRGDLEATHFLYWSHFGSKLVASLSVVSFYWKIVIKTNISLFKNRCNSVVQYTNQCIKYEILPAEIHICIYRCI